MPLNSNEIRYKFLNFFSEKGHHIVPSAPMVVKNDSTLMFTNAGMNQFKDIFLGNEPAKRKRVADTQKCLRVSGKHNDLEEVGLDTYHHTMFEMLGNWSFGDYFKKEAIEWAWELLTGCLGITPDRLYATVFEGDMSENLERDNEAAQLWAKFLPADRILNGSKKDNFWEMGDSGPCGPCSEVHIDIRDDDERAKVPGRELVNSDHPQVIEIWNLVFIQYNRKANGNLEELPAKHVDTGMGFERLCMVVQKKKSNYDTDIFQPVISEIGKLSNKKYGQNRQVDVAMRVIADHLRAVSFAIADGQLPSNNKAGYVIRRILRRAVRYGYTFLEFREPFICKLVETLKDTMGELFPELAAQQTLIEKVIREEEESFLRTLETGIRLLDQLTEKAKAEKKIEISGKDAFTLYDTFGFSLDLTQLIARENGLTVNVDQFNAEMEQQKNRSRNAATTETDDWVVVREGDTIFVGYDCTVVDTQILRYRKVKQKNKEFFQIVLSATPFYAEMGGQVGDSGTLSSGAATIEILDTKKENNLSVHIAASLPEDVTRTFVAAINLKNRLATSCNHSATHLLHEALRETLGNHVEQKGSYVGPEGLRFDFSHFQKMTKEEIRRVEHIVNNRIRKNCFVDDMREIPVSQARAMGAMALFGEKYGEMVRVVQFGSSVELCGGTHVSATGQIGMFRIVGESSIAAGIRRIEAITAQRVEEAMDMQQDMVEAVRELFNNTPNLMSAIKKTINENADLKKEIEDFMREKIVGLRDRLLANAESINNIKVVQLNIEAAPDMIKNLAFQIRNIVNERLFFVVGSINEGKPSLTIMLSDDLVEQGMSAVAIVREAAKEINGGGGGQPFFATAGGKNANGLATAIEKARSWVEGFSHE